MLVCSKLKSASGTLVDKASNSGHYSGFLLIFGVGCCCAKPPLPSSDFMTSILLHLPHNPLVWMERGRSWARRQAGGGLMLGQQGSGKTGRLHNLLLLLHTALAAAGSSAHRTGSADQLSSSHPPRLTCPEVPTCLLACYHLLPSLWNPNNQIQGRTTNCTRTKSRR